ncbi:MAG: glycosyltransferase [Gaiellaceae bacterium]
MRVALCANGRSPHAVRWANAVVDRGHEIALVWPDAAFDGADLASFRPSISHHTYALPGMRSKPWTLLASPRRRSRLARLLEPDLVHGFYLSGSGLVAHSFGVRPLVLTALGSDVGDLSRGGAGAYLAWRTRRAVADADVVLADSAPLAETIRLRVPGTDARLIRFGVEIGEATPSARSSWRRRLEVEDDAFVLLSSRLLQPNYNIDTIIRALASVRRDIPDAVLVLKEQPSFSDIDYRRRVFDLADELGVGGAIRHVSEVEREELLDLYHVADVYLSVPSSDGTAVSVLEAMVAGVPVVATDVPGIDPAILRDEQTAFLVPPREADSLAAAIVRLEVDHERRVQVTATARDVAERLGDIEKELDRAVALYEELVAAHRRN